MRRQHHPLIPFVVVLSVLACKSDSKSVAPEPGVISSSNARTVTLLVDGTEAGALGVAAAMPRRTLRDSVADRTPPHDQWERVVAVGNARRLEIAMADYRGYDLLLYQDSKARPALGLFRRTPSAEDAPLQAVVDLERIEIQTAGADKAPTEATLEVSRRGATQTISQDQLATLAAVPWRTDGKKQQASAWSLRAVLALTGPLETRVALTIRNAAGAESVQELAAADAETVLIKDNQRGSFHLKRLDASGKTVWRFKNATAISIE